MDDVIEMARGRWPMLLGKWLDERAIAGKHTKCPMCVGKDRFRFDDKDGRGTWICGHCGAGDGPSLLMAINGWDFADAAKYIKQNAGRFTANTVKPGRSIDEIRARLRKVWEGSAKLSNGDPVWKYLERRCGITTAPNGLRFHPALPYKHEDETITLHPAMLAQVVGGDGVALTIHRTYLTDDGQKANLPTTKKLMSTIRPLSNVAIRLADPDDGYLGVAEGIETALSASKRFRVPVWACVSAGLMEGFRPPDGIRFLGIFGDSDESYTGQASAYKLGRAVKSAGLDCRVELPERLGTDWADYMRNEYE